MAAAAAADYAPPTAECREFIAHRLPPGLRWDTVQVPENWAHPELARIRVFYYWRMPRSAPAEGVAPGARVPVVFVNGGPAHDSHSSSILLEKQAASADMPYVYFDQRGTGCSTPFPGGETAMDFPRLAHYGSTAIVRDLEAIRARLLDDPAARAAGLFGGQSRWKVSGQSYGAMIAQRYVAIAPEGLYAAYAYAYALRLEDDPVGETVELLRGERRVVRDHYLPRFPGLEATIARVRSQVPADARFVQGKLSLAGPDILDTITSALSFTYGWPKVTDAIRASLRADGALSTDGLAQLAQNHFYRSAETWFHWMFLGRFELPGMEFGPQDCAPALDRLRDAGEDPDHWPINDCRAVVATHYEGDAAFDELRLRDPLLVRDLDAALKAHPELPFYLYSGEQDLDVPRELFAGEVQALGGRPGFHYRNFPDAGHEGFFTEATYWQDLRR